MLKKLQNYFVQWNFFSMNVMCKLKNWLANFSTGESIYTFKVWKRWENLTSQECNNAVPDIPDPGLVHTNQNPFQTNSWLVNSP